MNDIPWEWLIFGVCGFILAMLGVMVIAVAVIEIRKQWNASK